MKRASAHGWKERASLHGGNAGASYEHSESFVSTQSMLHWQFYLTKHAVVYRRRNLTPRAESAIFLKKGDSFKCDGTRLPEPLCEAPFFFGNISCVRCSDTGDLNRTRANPATMLSEPLRLHLYNRDESAWRSPHKSLPVKKRGNGHSFDGCSRVLQTQSLINTAR